MSSSRVETRPDHTPITIAPVASRSHAEMERLRTGQVLVTNRGEGAAAPGVLDADPRQRRVEIVAAVHEPRAGLHLVADRERGVLVRGPDRRGQAKRAVVHQADRLLVGPDLHDPDDGPEVLLAHHRHRVVDAEQHLRRHVGRAGLAGGERLLVDQAARPWRPTRRSDAHPVGGRGPHDRTERGPGIDGSPSTYLRVRATQPSTNLS